MKVALVLLLCACTAFSDDWSRFRGPNGAGVDDGAPLPDSLAPDSALWATELPQGKSSPALTDDTIFLTGHDEKQLLTMALDRATGRVLWRRAAPSRRAEKLHNLNSEASSSPVTDGENVFVFFGGYGLLSYGPDGNERWRLPLGPFTNFHGMGASPIYVDGKIIMVCDQDLGSFVLAVDAKDGSLLWRTERPDMVHSYTTPVIYRPADGPAEVIAPGSYQIVSYRLDDGEELWRWRGMAYQVKGTAVIEGDRLYFNAWSVGGTAARRLVLPEFKEALARADADGDGLLAEDEIPKEWEPDSPFAMQDLNKDGKWNEKEWRYYTMRRTSTNSTVCLRLGGRGDVTNTHTIWQIQKNMPEVPAVLVYRDVAYLIKNGAIFTAFNASTGDVLKQGRIRAAMDNYYSSPVAGDGKIFLASEQGLVSVVRAGAEWESLATADFGEPIFATPVISGGRIYLRVGGELYCFGKE